MQNVPAELAGHSLCLAGAGPWLSQLSVPWLRHTHTPQGLFYIFCTYMQIINLVIILSSQITLFRCLSYILLSCHTSHKRDLHFPINGEIVSRTSAALLSSALSDSHVFWSPHLTPAGSYSGVEAQQLRDIE